MPTEWLQQHPLILAMNHTNRTFFLLRLHLANGSLDSKINFAQYHTHILIYYMKITNILVLPVFDHAYTIV